MEYLCLVSSKSSVRVLSSALSINGVFEDVDCRKSTFSFACCKRGSCCAVARKLLTDSTEASELLHTHKKTVASTRSFTVRPGGGRWETKGVYCPAELFLSCRHYVFVVDMFHSHARLCSIPGATHIKEMGCPVGLIGLPFHYF